MLCPPAWVEMAGQLAANTFDLYYLCLWRPCQRSKADWAEDPNRAMAKCGGLG
jgi:hypothetical protein